MANDSEAIRLEQWRKSCNEYLARLNKMTEELRNNTATVPANSVLIALKKKSGDVERAGKTFRSDVDQVKDSAPGRPSSYNFSSL